MFISHKVKNLICVFLVAIIALPGFGQGIFSKQKIKNQYAAFGIGGGTSHYFGDLAPYRYAYYGIYTNVRWNGTLNYTRYLTPNIGARASFSYARIFGSDMIYSSRNIDKLWQNYIRNLHFRNDIKEFAVSGIYNLRDINGKNARSRADFMPYLTAGVGFISHKPKARGPLKGDWVDLHAIGTAGQGNVIGKKTYSLVQVVFPVSAGFRYKINEKWDFAAEFGLRVTPFDYLDDVGYDLYVDPVSTTWNSPDDSKIAYRADEALSSYNLASRTSQFIAIYNDPTKLNGPPVAPVAPDIQAKNIYGFAKGSYRGTARPDSYIMTQFTISYILSNSIKCPVIK
jgi:hypothetical protein